MSFERVISAFGLCTICLVLLFHFPTTGHSQAVAVGDIQIDPKDFSSDRDQQTRTAPCLACHGKHAGGDIDFGPDANFGTPALRGMRHSYLKQSLIAYKTGSRTNKEMQVIASLLDEEAIDFMAYTFAAYPAPPTKTAEELATLTSRDSRFQNGQAIAQQGVPEKEVPACMTCHGELGQGDADLGPRLAGQNGLYIQRQFKAFSDKTRQTAQAEIMQPVAAVLSADEIEAIAYYYQNIIDNDKP